MTLRNTDQVEPQEPRDDLEIEAQPQAVEPPRTVCTARLGRPLSAQYIGAKRSSSIRERLVPENLGPTPLQAPGLLPRNQELGLPQAHLWVSLSETCSPPPPRCSTSPLPHIPGPPLPGNLNNHAPVPARTSCG